MTRRKAQSTTILSQSQRLLPRQPWHRWTDEELNLLAYYRTRHWSYARIQRKHFPSFTQSSLWGAYSRIPRKERAHRASIVAGSITTSRTASRNKESTRSHPTPETNHRSHLVSQTEANIGTHRSSTLRCEEDNRPLTPIDGTNRYNFRSNRCRSFQESQSQYPIDRRRFPHFFKSYKNHLKLDGVPDRDYAPPSHSSTPDSSDRSPSVISSLPSTASSLELFGLEARSLTSSERGALVTPSPPNDALSPEIFNLEEHPPTPWLTSRNLSNSD
ncbi:hypothetical protein BJX62DRAFT_206267 [Aspergillus germanicus]|jgi:hypothetical protein